MTIYDIFPDIQNNPIFHSASEETVNRYLTEDVLKIERFSAGESVYSSNTETIRVGILQTGAAKVYSGTPETSEYSLLKALAPGDMFGIANLYAESEPFPSRIVAVGDGCTVLFAEGEAFKTWIESDPIALRNYLTFQSRKIVYLNRKIMTYTAGSAEKKLALYLLDQAIDATVCLSCSMSDLAALLGMGRASLYRAVDTLTQYGWIVKQDRSFLLCNPKALEEFI